MKRSHTEEYDLFLHISLDDILKEKPDSGISLLQDATLYYCCYNLNPPTTESFRLPSWTQQPTNRDQAKGKETSSIPVPGSLMME